MLDTPLGGDHPRIISANLVEIGRVVSEEKIFFKFHHPFSIFSLADILVGSRDHRTHFWKGAIQGPFTKVWLQLAEWFLKRRLLCEFPIRFYVKLSSAVGAILIEGPNRRTHFWKRTIQWLFHQNWVLIEQMVSDKNILMGISHRVLCSIKFGCGGHLGRRSQRAGHNFGRAPHKDHFSKVW